MNCDPHTKAYLARHKAARGKELIARIVATVIFGAIFLALTLITLDMGMRR